MMFENYTREKVDFNCLYRVRFECLKECEIRLNGKNSGSTLINVSSFEPMQAWKLRQGCARDGSGWISGTYDGKEEGEWKGKIKNINK